MTNRQISNRVRRELGLTKTEHVRIFFEYTYIGFEYYTAIVESDEHDAVYEYVVVVKDTTAVYFDIRRKG